MRNNKVILTIEGYLKPKTYIENGKKRAAIEIIANDIDFSLKTKLSEKHTVNKRFEVTTMLKGE